MDPKSADMKFIKRSCTRLVKYTGTHDLPSRICIVTNEENVADPDLLAAAEVFQVPIVICDSYDIQAHIVNKAYDTVFVLQDFHGPLFQQLKSLNWRILGPTALKQTAVEQKELLRNTHPLFSLSMMDLKIVISGYPKERKRELIDLIRYMGGSSREEVKRNVTHLVAKKTGSRAYSEAVALDIPIMSEEWILHCWKNRFYIINAAAPDVMKYTCPMFSGKFICNYGFEPAESEEINKVVVENGGEAVNIDHPKLSHLVLNSPSHTQQFVNNNQIKHIVGREWISKSLYLNSSAEEACCEIRSTTPKAVGLLSPKYNNRISLQKQFEEHIEVQIEKQMEEHIEEIEEIEEHIEEQAISKSSDEIRDCSEHKTSDIDYFTPLNRSLQFIDEVENQESSSIWPPMKTDVTLDISVLESSRCHTASKKEECIASTPEPDQGPHDNMIQIFQEISDVTDSEKSARCNSNEKIRTPVIQELFQTEQNYLLVLDSLLKAKEETRNSSDNCEPLLKVTESRYIFANLHLIHKIHTELQQELELLAANLNECSCVGNVIKKFCKDFETQYPAYVNFYERSQDMIIACDEKKTAFHDFLQRCKHDPESVPYFNRESLKDLMIRPVQRLASTVLILKELLKRTAADHPDHLPLTEAISELSAVVKQINTAKAKSEDFCNIFAAYNMILNCPPSLVCARRKMTMQFEALELSSGGFSKDGDYLVFFVFKCKTDENDSSLSDTLEVCKVRSRVVALGNALTPHQLLHETNGKPYKHLKSIRLEDIISIVDITDCTDTFNLIVRDPQENTTKSYTLQLIDNACSKEELLEYLIINLPIDSNKMEQDERDITKTQSLTTAIMKRL